ncbi:RCC1 domain-containing protein [Streptomyces sp. CB01881]|uniref:RCC1 domain-containing protein n=1 Tax=Streptomyces sp. CB01881 TaxID=2078691 RepID=UPI000CDBE2EC|nr:RCC1 domain-containing protein [Streptomyces sp. CB01881]AUY53055.1 hypothetical protein C2142_33720 [Streptomyces sp. CB01881]TYC70770.1 hypothetical protein EH183_33780 [Streptomyces sp. CB01881]
MTWGSNILGQLGDGTTTDRTTPVQVCAQGASAPCTSFLNGVTRAAAGYGHTVALRSDGTARTWGYNSSGQLGNGTTSGSTTPVRVCAVGLSAPCGTFESSLTAVAAGSQTLALRADGGVHAWGSNSFGLLGDGTTTDRSTPVRSVRSGRPRRASNRSPGPSPSPPPPTTPWRWSGPENPPLGRPGRPRHDERAGDRAAEHPRTGPA